MRLSLFFDGTRRFKILMTGGGGRREAVSFFRRVAADTHRHVVGVFFLSLLLVAAASSVGLAADEFVALVVLLMWRCLEFKKSWGELSNMTKGLLSTGPYAACSTFLSNILMFCVSFLSRILWGAGDGDALSDCGVL